MKDKKFHLYLYEENGYERHWMIHDYQSVKEAIDNDESYIHTTQVMLCKMSLIEKGYKIFIHYAPNKKIEITLGACEHIDSELRLSHNLPNLIINGAFDVFNI